MTHESLRSTSFPMTLLAACLVVAGCSSSEAENGGSAGGRNGEDAGAAGAGTAGSGGATGGSGSGSGGAAGGGAGAGGVSGSGGTAVVSDAGSTPEAGSATDAGQTDGATGPRKHSTEIMAPEGIALLHDGWGGTTTPHIAIFGPGFDAQSVSGFEILEAATGARKARLSTNIVAFGGLGFQRDTLDEGSFDGIVYRDMVGRGRTEWISDTEEFGMIMVTSPCFMNPCPPLDLARIGADPGDGFLDVRAARVGYEVLRPGASEPGNTTLANLASAADAGTPGEIRSAAMHDLEEKTLVVTAAEGDLAARLWLHDPTAGGAAVALDPPSGLGTDPRFIRCAEPVCVLTNFESDDVSVIVWDGTNEPASVAAAAVGTGPLGVDVVPMGGDIVAAVVNTTSADLSVLHLSAAGAVTSNDLVPLTDCDGPRDVALLPATQQAAVTCRDDSAVTIVDLP